jgi:hypothetical protein
MEGNNIRVFDSVTVRWRHTWSLVSSDVYCKTKINQNWQETALNTKYFTFVNTAQIYKNKVPGSTIISLNWTFAFLGQAGIHDWIYAGRLQLVKRILFISSYPLRASPLTVLWGSLPSITTAAGCTERNTWVSGSKTQSSTQENARVSH